MAIEKISTKTNLKEWMNTINELIDSNDGKLNSSDNAVSASKLLTARKINGTSFNGTADITTANWGTARNITISDSDGTNSGTTTSVNGSANVTLHLPSTIKASLSGNASTATIATKANQLTTARTIGIGGVVTGTATSFNGTANITIDTTSLNLEDSGITGELPTSHGGTGRTDGKAVGLATARTIDGVSFDGTANRHHFGVCSTAADTAAKTVSVTGFVLGTGAEVTVQFSKTNTASSPTLNVNSTGAKAIVYRNSAISAGNLASGRVYKFVYDGTNYELIGDINTDTNTDTKVTQTVTTTNAEYALLTMADASATATKTNGARFASAVTLNPSTKKITCAGLSGTTPKSTWVDAAKSGGSLLDYPDNSAGAFAPFIRYKTTNGAFVIGGYKTEFGFYYLPDENIEAGTNTATESIKINESGVLSSTGGFSGSLSGNASTASKAAQLTTARTIDGVSFNGTANITHFGSCSTAAATAAKTVSCTGFTLTTGARIIVRFTVTNTASSPTLNVNSTGAKAIVYRNSAISAGYLAANRVYEFVYDGTNYELVGDINTDTNTDTKVTQTVSTTNNTYPILACATANATVTATTTAIFCKNIKINPSAGSITATKVYNAVWNDYAEFFPRGEETEPGDIIALDENSEEEKYIRATKDSILIVGSHSDTFGHLIGGETPPDDQDFVEYNLPKYIPVGLSGRVRVKFKGKSKKGYPVTISDVPGVAEMCDFNEKKIIGYIVEDTNSNSEDIRFVKILIRN